MNEYAYIFTTRHQIPIKGFYETYEWVGKKHLPVIFSRGMEDVVDKLPFPLKRIDEHDPFIDGYKYIRTDVNFWWITFLKTKLSYVWMWFYCRFIITLNVWGLAYTNPACVPSWRDIGKKRPY